MTAELAALKKATPGYNSTIYAITVGSEALYRGDMTAAQLVTKISQVRALMGPNVKLGTADSWNKFQDGTANPVVAVADIILANAFSYWQGVTINSAPQTFFGDIYQAIEQIQKAAGSTSVDFWVGETGWPTVGGVYESAAPSVANAQTYFQHNICAMTTWGFNVFVFEAFDEPNKPNSTGQNGESEDEGSWGVWDVNHKLKYDITCN
jgi:glucan 1,3-beta-glucosidase